MDDGSLHADDPVAAADPGAVLIAGGSGIVDPLGQGLAGPARDGATVPVADPDPADLDRAVFDLDVVGHDAAAGFRLLEEARPRTARVLPRDPPEAPNAG